MKGTDWSCTSSVNADDRNRFAGCTPRTAPHPDHSAAYRSPAAAARFTVKGGDAEWVTPQAPRGPTPPGHQELSPSLLLRPELAERAGSPRHAPPPVLGRGERDKRSLPARSPSGRAGRLSSRQGPPATALPAGPAPSPHHPPHRPRRLLMTSCTGTAPTRPGPSPEAPAGAAAPGEPAARPARPAAPADWRLNCTLAGSRGEAEK